MRKICSPFAPASLAKVLISALLPGNAQQCFHAEWFSRRFERLVFKADYLHTPSSRKAVPAAGPSGPMV
jgi:hypothetical protein